METTLNKQTAFRLSAKTREIIVDIIAYSFIMLFMYTAADKLLTIKSFASTLAKSPLIGGYHMIVAWAIPIIEIIISIILIIPSARKTGLQASFLLMTTFTLYLTYMVFSGSKLPCHCGGVISTMTWQQHIWFNLAFVTLAIFGITISGKK